MGFDDLKKKAEEALNSDKTKDALKDVATDAIDRVDDALKDATDGKFGDKIDDAANKAKDALGKL
ncbi:hypothetical protein [Actinomyces vulturis]|uniref:hypothetical protein n=1 Tax=Actinomyces vulturis TaxID=1857645 RepID=UPI000830BD88|nr:hypothetical protein [Actinomyces vulturis]